MVNEFTTAVQLGLGVGTDGTNTRSCSWLFHLLAFAISSWSSLSNNSVHRWELRMWDTRRGTLCRGLCTAIRPSLTASCRVRVKQGWCSGMSLWPDRMEAQLSGSGSQSMAGTLAQSVSQSLSAYLEMCTGDLGGLERLWSYCWRCLWRRRWLC